MTSQRRRRFVYRALTTGQITPWDFQRFDAGLVIVLLAVLLDRICCPRQRG